MIPEDPVLQVRLAIISILAIKTVRLFKVKSPAILSLWEITK